MAEFIIKYYYINAVVYSYKLVTDFTLSTEFYFFLLFQTSYNFAKQIGKKKEQDAYKGFPQLH